MRSIDADALKRAIKTECNPYGKPTIDFESGKKVLEIIDNAPTIEERPKGKWIKRFIITNKRSFDICVCSNCRTEFSWDAETGVSMDNYDTCPNCGADMRDTPKEKTCENCSFREHQEVCITCSRNYSDQYYDGEVAFSEENDNRH